MTRTVRESANPIFEDKQSWKVPAQSEAVHNYLIDEGTDIGTFSGKASPKARVVASIHLPLFPLARNHKIRGTFPLLDRADESVISEASIDVSIYWKFAYIFDGFENLTIEENIPLRKFTPLTEENGLKRDENKGKNGRNGTEKEDAKNGEKEEENKVISMEEKNVRKKRKEIKTKRTISKEQKALAMIGIRQMETDKLKGDDSSADESKQSESEEAAEEQWGEEMPEEELRRRLFQLPKPMKKVMEEKITQKDTEIKGQKSQAEESLTSETDQSKTSEEPISDETPKSVRILATIVVDDEKALEGTASADELSEDLLKEGSFSAEGEEQEKKKTNEEKEAEEEEEENGSIRSDGTYTAEGPLGPIEMDEPRIKGQMEEEEEEDGEEVMIIRDEDFEGRTGQTHAEFGDRIDEADEEKLTEPMAPVPAPRRSSVGPIPPIATAEAKPQKKQPAPLPPPPTTELVTTRKAVDFAEPLHSSIPPSDVSSSFTEDVTFGSGRSSNSSETNGGGSTTSNGTPRSEERQQQQQQNGEEEQEKQQKVLRKKHREKKPTKAPIQIAPAPQTPAIRVRSAISEFDPKIEEAAEGSSVDLVPPKSANVQIRIGKFRLLDHSPLLFSQFDGGGRVFVEWNFLDFEREQCATENGAQMPRLSTESVNFDHCSDYVLNQSRIALLSQWTELNIRFTFTLVMDPGEGNGGDLDDLCMGELDLLDVLDTSAHSLIMRNVDNMSMAVLEVDISYSDNLLDYLREAMREIMGEEKDDEEDGEEGGPFEIGMENND